jgi:hypothetical protein
MRYTYGIQFVENVRQANFKHMAMHNNQSRHKVMQLTASLLIRLLMGDGRIIVYVRIFTDAKPPLRNANFSCSFFSQQALSKNCSALEYKHFGVRSTWQGRDSMFI